MKYNKYRTPLFYHDLALDLFKGAINMPNNVATKTLVVEPIINSNLTIANYNDLINSVERIKRQYENVQTDNKGARKITRRLNKLKRNLNNLRKDKGRPTRKQLKAFKANIDYLIDGISQAEVPFKLQLKQARKIKLKDKQMKMQEQMNLICKHRGIKPIKVTMADAKKRMSKSNRLSMLIQNANQELKLVELSHAAIVHGMAVDANGEIIGKAKKITVVGSKQDIKKLEDWAKKNGVIIQS